ncbi:MAG TPA: EAL domain-containing protein [Xanthomonadales bacterium]|nr:EAL domain-containing protein [Xanthomonadales bacterium]
MESVNLLFLDRTPEPAENINSLLRNSGIKVHVIHVESYADVNRALESYSPILILYADPDPVDAGIEEISELAANFSVPCALYCDLEDTERLVGLLKNAACIVIDCNNDQQLITAVSRLLDTQSRINRSSEQKSRLDELEHRYDLLLDSSREAIAYIHEGLHVYANRAYLELIHVEDSDELQGISLLEMMKIADGNFKTVLRNLTKGRFPSDPVEVQVNRNDGSQFDAALQFSPATFNGEECIQMRLQERDEATELQAEIERIRVTDALTQLSNRARFMSQLTEFLNRDPDPRLASAVLYIEPDVHDQPNSAVGLSGIDAHVVELANVIRQYLEDGDACGRIRDTGIAVLVSRGNKEKLTAFAKAIQNAYQNVVIEVDGSSFTSSCSVGIVPLGRLASDADSVIAQAQQAFSEATDEEENLVVFRPQLTAVAPAEDESEWVDRIRFGLKNEDFVAVHQSIVDLDGEGDHVFENLVFLRGEETEHPAIEFAAVADKHELSGFIDRSVIPGILRSVSDHAESQIISLSTHSIADPAFPGWLREQFRMYAVDAGKLIIQIPADSAQANLKPTQRLMKDLIPLGCKLSISSFGPERRTLQLFEHLDVHFVKLHTELTEELQGNSKAQESIRQIVDTANEHESVVIADEITDTSNLAILWQCGVKMIAGAFLKEDSQVIAQ